MQKAYHPTAVDLVPEPVNDIEVTMPVDNIKFTDCHEMCIWRMMQTFFIDPKNPERVNKKAVLLAMRPSPVRDFVIKNSKIMTAKDFCRSPEGQKLRNQWSYLLSGVPGFQYKIQNAFEYKANFHNLIYFFQLHFYLRIKESEPEEAIKEIARYFSSKNTYQIEGQYTEDLKYSSGYLYTTESCKFTFDNKVVLDWYLTQRFLGDVRMNGHSQVYMSYLESNESEDALKLELEKLKRANSTGDIKPVLEFKGLKRRNSCSDASKSVEINFLKEVIRKAMVTAENTFEAGGLEDFTFDDFIY